MSFNYKIAVHITFFLGKNYLNRIEILKKVINSYKKISKNLDIFGCNKSKKADPFGGL